MKRKSFALLLSALLTIGACAAPSSKNGEIPESPKASVPIETDAITPSATEHTAREEASAKQNKAPAEAQPAQKYIDEGGLLTDAAKERIDALLAEYPSIGCSVFPGLFDFTRDGVPELYLVFHSGGQGLMPVVVFSLDGERLGEFEGYCSEGFCRFSYGENCVYVHNKYEHSMHTSCDLVTRLTVEDGVLSAEQLFWRPAAVGDRFPLKESVYYLGEKETDRDGFYEAYNNWLFGEDERMTREANELSLCTYDLRFAELPEEDERADAVISVYHQYIAAKNAATEKLGAEPTLFAFDDFDRNGLYEAFIQASPSDPLYFWNGAELNEIPDSATGGLYDFTRIGELLFAQPFGNGLPCSIYSVHEKSFYEHENSRLGMLIRTSKYYPFECNINDEFVLYDSTFEPHHTHKPYFFTDSCAEIVAEPVTEADFSDREDVLAALDELKADLSFFPEGAEIVGMYLRGGEYLHVNFTLPAETEDTEGEVYPLPYYRTYLIQNGVVPIDKGAGHYTEKLGE